MEKTSVKPGTWAKNRWTESKTAKLNHSVSKKNRFGTHAVRQRGHWRKPSVSGLLRTDSPSTCSLVSAVLVVPSSVMMVML